MYLYNTPIRLFITVVNPSKLRFSKVGETSPHSFRLTASSNSCLRCDFFKKTGTVDVEVLFYPFRTQVEAGVEDEIGTGQVKVVLNCWKGPTLLKTTVRPAHLHISQNWDLSGPCFTTLISILTCLALLCLLVVLLSTLVSILISILTLVIQVPVLMRVTCWSGLKY